MQLDSQGHVKREFEKYKMATTALHRMGDISSDVPDLCFVYAEDDDSWYGNWVTGFGFFDVKFPKATTRDLTEDEIKEYSNKTLYVGNSHLGKVYVT